MWVMVWVCTDKFIQTLKCRSIVSAISQKKLMDVRVN